MWLPVARPAKHSLQGYILAYGCCSEGLEEMYELPYFSLYWLSLIREHS